MKSVVRLPLNPKPEQHQKLLALQKGFSRLCNALAPTVQESRVWNRVALHHMAYRKLRQAYPEMGSQMVCNAIYSVSRAARLVYQTPGSPFHHAAFAGKALPRLQFSDSAPVYFDRHTLSLKGGHASMFTLDGRMRFELKLQPEVERSFHERKLLEIVLQRQGERFELLLIFGDAESQGVSAEPAVEPGPAKGRAVAGRERPTASSLPSYLCVEAQP